METYKLSFLSCQRMNLRNDLNYYDLHSYLAPDNSIWGSEFESQKSIRKWIWSNEDTKSKEPLLLRVPETFGGFRSYGFYPGFSVGPIDLNEVCRHQNAALEDAPIVGFSFFHGVAYLEAVRPILKKFPILLPIVTAVNIGIHTRVDDIASFVKLKVAIKDTDLPKFAPQTKYNQMTNLAMIVRTLLSKHKEAEVIVAKRAAL